MKTRFTIFVLLYGDYQPLAQRCLSSILTRTKKADRDLRIGMNDVCAGTRQLVHDMLKAGEIRQESIYDNGRKNLHKYPLMRLMFNDIANPIATPYVMWFDDDSYLKDVAEFNGTPWLDAVAISMASHDMIGAIYGMEYRGRQEEWVKQQPWYRNKPFYRSRKTGLPKFQFATGGWWTIRTELLQRYDYPWPALDHRGGDVMLGELCNQQGLRLGRFNAGVAINADSNGRESKAKRRGWDAKPIGVEYTAATPAPPRRKVIDLGL